MLGSEAKALRQGIILPMYLYVLHKKMHNVLYLCEPVSSVFFLLIPFSSGNAFGGAAYTVPCLFPVDSIYDLPIRSIRH